jgi:hypothetical protein
VVTTTAATVSKRSGHNNSGEEGTAVEGEGIGGKLKLRGEGGIVIDGGASEGKQRRASLPEVDRATVGVTPYTKLLSL